MKYSTTLIIVLLFHVLGCKTTENQPIDAIPFILMNDNRIYTYCSVNESDSLLFLIDTGASDMVINSERLSKVKMIFDSHINNLGTTGSNTVKKSTKNDILWGKQKQQDISFIAIPYPNDRWDGVLGLSLLRKYTVEINYDKKMIFLYDKEKYSNNSPHYSPITYIHQVPFVKIQIESKGKTFNPLVEIDTGSDRIIDLSTPFVEKYQLNKHFDPPYAISQIVSSDGNSGKINNVYFDELTIVKKVFYKIPGGLSDVKFGMLADKQIDGMMGNTFLKRFNLIFDFKNNYLYWDPNNYLYTPFYLFLVL